MVEKTKQEWKHKGNLFGMTYVTWEERQTNGSLFEKTLSLKSEKHCSVKRRDLSKYYICIYKFRLSLQGLSSLKYTWSRILFATKDSWAQLIAEVLFPILKNRLKQPWKL